MSDQPLAVTDIGSNSGRVVVVQLDDGHLRILSDARVPLRLASELKAGNLSAAAIARTLSALRDFQAIAEGAGAARSILVATSAVREASNGDELVTRVRDELGLDVEIIDGDQEARYAFLGAVHSLAVDHGLLVDIGGGSLEITHFRDRSVAQTWTLPLGALRITERFLAADPPTPREVHRLGEHLTHGLLGAGIPPLEADEVLVCTGGSVRTLARIDRRERNYPIPRIHGYVLPAARVEAIEEMLAGRSLAKRATLRGLNANRADSIVGGAVVARIVLEVAKASEMVVSGQGLREGIAVDRLLGVVPAASEVRGASVRALAARHAEWREGAAVRRAQIAERLRASLDPDAAEETRELLTHAATIFDVGRSMDYYSRAKNTATIVISSDLIGFTHRHLAMLAVMIRRVEDPGAAGKTYRALLSDEDMQSATRSATVLALADELNRRMPASEDGDVTCIVRGRDVIVRSRAVPGWWSSTVGERVRLVFGKGLRLEEAR